MLEDCHLTQSIQELDCRDMLLAQQKYQYQFFNIGSPYWYLSRKPLVPRADPLVDPKLTLTRTLKQLTIWLDLLIFNSAGTSLLQEVKHSSYRFAPNISVLMLSLTKRVKVR